MSAGTRAGARTARSRNAELLLLGAAVVLTVFGYASVGLATTGEVPGELLMYGIGLTVAAGVAHLAVRRFAPHADPLILPLAVALSGLGLVLIHRLDISYKIRYNSPAAASNQVMWSAVGLAVLLAILFFLKDHRHLQRYTYIIVFAALVLLMAPAFFPGDSYGAKRWIRLGALSFQPGEFVRIAIAVFFAGYLTMHKDALALASRRVMGFYLPRGRQFGPIAAVWVLSLLVLIFERDLGTSLIFFGLFVIMLYAATERSSWVISGLLMFVVGAAVVGSMEPHVHGRVVAWLHPMDIYLPHPPKGLTSPQAAEALFSFGSGGVLGTGLGRGHSDLIGFAGRSDFILTTVGEELGLAGMMAVFLLYALLVERGLRTALDARDPFGKLLATGLSGALALQVFVVAGGVTGLMPLTGKALPFLAQGGSSQVANWVLIALLLKISDAARRPAPEPANDLDDQATQLIRR
ncbi:FtsW/RodA/SpoVE family cell cycle protein [Streptomyces sp. UNOC14_S4]|uniref:FtsW/RodA/SpoVE family cell cycle protein n=1 Tax=Streptomyces sp. UNOC14_S4 TaxID=2872340 RepID=UPI001E50AD41|nr:FtsW/RodA/SpoVE family cell cycle protein [Streptomyces sp. UNOC14_S4]MCC3768280.1 FtsW/RodA/SpoVE family cell cycle protein [Streptomyces sp. UNOC14_S4]